MSLGYEPTAAWWIGKMVRCYPLTGQKYYRVSAGTFSDKGVHDLTLVEGPATSPPVNPDIVVKLSGGMLSTDNARYKELQEAYESYLKELPTKKVKSISFMGASSHPDCFDWWNQGCPGVEVHGISANAAIEVRNSLLSLPKKYWLSRDKSSHQKTAAAIATAPLKESNHSPVIQPAGGIMIAAILKSFAIVTILSMSALGAVTAAIIAALALGQMEVGQVTTGLQSIVDESRYYLGGWGITSAVAAVRAARPFIVSGIRNWIVDAVQNSTNNQR